MTRVTTPDVWYKIFGSLEKETPKAYLWKTPDKRTFWMPISQTRKLNTLPDIDGHSSIEVKEWILNDKAVPGSQRYDLEYPGPSANPAVKPVTKQELDSHFDDYEDDIPF